MIIKEGTIRDILDLQHLIPEFENSYSEEEYISRLKKDIYYLILIAYENNNAIGFKVGYALDAKTFYSWMGAVLPEYRRQQVAKLLMKKQEDSVSSKNFKKIRVKSRNYFPNMLRFLITSNYLIVDYIDKGDFMKNKIVFEKEL